MRRAVVLSSVLIALGNAPMSSAQQPDAWRDAKAFDELEGAYGDLVKAVSLSPNDESIRYWMMQIAGLQMIYLENRYKTLDARGELTESERTRLRGEMDRIGERIQSLGKRRLDEYCDPPSTAPAPTRATARRLSRV